MINGFPISQWMLVFYIYCFFGWCFESTYVSVFCLHRWVNRGFLTGPALPLYGSGALVILLATSPVRGSVWLTGLVGMAACTLLEYVTGVAMEAIFKVRYWDYSDKRFNFQGHICLQSSLAWGVLSVLVVNVIHPPIWALVERIDERVCQLAVLVISIIFTADLTHAVIAAIDLKRLLAWLDGARGEMKNVQARIEAIEAQLMEEYHLRRDQIADGLKSRRDGLADSIRQRGDQLADSYHQRLDQLQQELSGLSERQEMLRSWVSERFGPAVRRLLRGNPDALSHAYHDAMERLRERLKHM